LNREPPIVLLVHGTWARRWRWARRRGAGPPATWCDPGSSFLHALSLGLDGDVIFDRFSWSGDNTAQARYDAAHALAYRVESVRRAKPRSALFVVGHSHGGTVACLAARYAVARTALSGIVTIATPFLRTRSLPPEKEYEGLWAFGLVLMLAPWFLVMMADLNDWFPRPLMGGLTATALIVWVVVAALALNRLQAWTRRRSQEVRSYLVDPEGVQAPLLILRQAGDDAYLALRIASITSRVLRRTRWWFQAFWVKAWWTVIALVMALCVGMWGFLVYSILTAGLGPYDGPKWPLQLVLWGLVAIFGIIAVAGTMHVGALALAGLIQIVYGADLATSTPDIEVLASDTLVSRHAVINVPSDAGTERVGQWIRANFLDVSHLEQTRTQK
jgi:hypothetical protein